MLTCNWKYVPNVPRISFSDISEVYKGTIIEYEPLANPVKSLPAQIHATFKKNFLSTL